MTNEQNIARLELEITQLKTHFNSRIQSLQLEVAKAGDSLDQKDETIQQLQKQLQETAAHNQKQ